MKCSGGSVKHTARPKAIHDLIRGVVMEVYQVKEGCALEGRTLAEADLRGKTGVMVLAIQTDSQVQANPTPDARFTVGSVALLLGTAEQLAKAAPLFHDSTAGAHALPEWGPG